MIRNYFKVALRNLSKNKIYVLINTSGMGIAIACCMSAYLLIAYNLEFDDYFNDDDINNVVKVVHHYKFSTGKQDRELVTPLVMAPQVAEEITGIEQYTRFSNLNGIMAYEENAFHENIRFADPAFFEIFKIGLKNGSPGNFKIPRTVFLSTSMAKKYFDDQDPVGEVMALDFNGKKYEVTVGGVMEKLPLNISFTLDALLPMDIYLDAFNITAGQWDSQHWASVLFKLNDIDQREHIGKQLDKYSALINQKQDKFTSLSFELIPFKTPIINGEVEESDLRLPIPTVALIIFSILAGIILLIACFNLTNTTLALTGKRLKEIGVRKVVGSARSQIIYQFLLEMIITVALAVMAGYVIGQLIVPQFAAMWHLEYGLDDLNKLNLMAALIILLFMAAILAGIYPAVLNSKFKPMELLKGRKEIKGTNFLTRSLLVIQFSLSVIVFIAGIVFTQNAAYQKELYLGYDKEKLLTISIHNEKEYERLKNTLTGNVKIENIAAAQNHISPYMAKNREIAIDKTTFKTEIYEVGPNYFKTIGLPIIEGRDFKEDHQSDLESSAIVDRNFIEKYALKDPIDRRIIYKDKNYRIIGVVENHLGSFKDTNNDDHLFVLSNPADYRKMVIRADSESRVDLLADIEKEWKELFPGQPFEGKLQEELVFLEADAYNKNLGQIFFFITVLGCLLSASGIYALASLNVQKRTKEIGIRKVLGANVNSIIKLLNREFAVILIIAIILGSAGGIFLTNVLLTDLYAQHLEIGIFTVVLCSLAIFIIGIATTSGTIFRTALLNPTDTLRSE